jgi:hypothetical protein
MTGFGTFDDAVRAMRLGCLDFFTKPATIRDICKALERVPSLQASGPLVVASDNGGMRVARVQAGGFTPTPWQHATIAWQSGEEAQQHFYSSLLGLMPAIEMRQITAELMQSTTNGTPSINVYPDSWSVWLQAPMVWSEHVEKCQLIKKLARNCTWADSGAIVECYHGQ